MQTQNTKIKEIIIPQEKEQGKDSKVIKGLKQSIAEVGLLNPITLNKENKLLCGYHRLVAYKNLGYETIPSIIKEEIELKEKLIQIDEDLVRKHLSPWDFNNVLVEQKEIYESLKPTSTKAFKSKNNSLPIEERIETEEAFSSSMANKLDCSPKSITNKITQVESIQSKSPELKNSISKLDKKIKVKGTDISKISKLSSTEMNDLSKQIEENLDNKNFNLSQVLEEEKTVEKSMKEKLHEVFMYDLLEVSERLSISKIQNEIKVNVGEAKKFKNELNADFKSEIDFLIKNIK